ncbi:MAG TPA: TonB-dependent receptor [Candidatus Aminicenantes bacterium]|nr:TonB-dependent receptor [Candidatus Aminicenantes bacterium]HRY64437.1 TonB-dependent receptor [Candidatus Aminicenantes bacterium]HRZ71350.1 TonB-dependent receptor [Candidatus Aminicenantes bacterium]
MRKGKTGFVILLVLLTAGLAAAQDSTQTGIIAGRVQDQQGNLLPGVSVTITSPAMIRETATAVTSTNGTYRFVLLPIGAYRVTFELPGFKTLVKTDVIVALRATTTVNAALDEAAVQETVTVVGEKPVVDIKSATISTNFTADMLQKLPSARDPWSLMEMTPGMVMNAQNVGGNASGSQSSGYSHGTLRSQTQYNLDGITVTDAAMNGASVMYFDFDSFAEISVETGAHAVDTQSSGVVLNMVTKSGGNTFSGGLSGYAEPNWKWIQADNVPDTPDYADAGAGNPTKYYDDYGGDIGGPIVKDRLWFYTAFRRTEINRYIIGYEVNGQPGTEYTDLIHWTGKLTGQTSKNNRVMVWVNFDNKIQPNRGAGTRRPEEVTWNQKGPAWYLHGEDTWTLSPNLLLNFKLGYYNTWWQEGPQSSVDLSAPSVLIRYSTPYPRMYQDAYYQYSKYYSDRLSITGSADYFKDDFLGGDHEIKVGFDYQHTPFKTDRQFPGNHTLYFSNMDRTGTREVWTWRQIQWAETNDIYSVYLQDIFTLKKHLTINLGLRFDSTHMHNDATSAPGNAWTDYYTERTGEAVPTSSPEMRNVVAWNVLYPRLGLTYDLFNDGSTVLKFNLSRYSYQVSYDPAYRVIATSYWEVDYDWLGDFNDDQEAQADELGDIIYTDIATKYTIDPNLKAPYINEAVIGLERRVTNDIGASLNFLYRETKRLFFPYNRAVDPTADYTAVPVTDPGPDGELGTADDGITVNAYSLNEDKLAAIDYYVTTRNGYKESYRGVEFSLRKKFSHHWLGQASVSYGRSNVKMPLSAVNDPNNRVFQDDVVAWNDCPWIVKVVGSYELPFGITVGGFFNYRSGMPSQRYLLFDGVNQGEVNVEFEKFGTHRYPSMTILDLRLSKVFDAGKIGTFEAMADVFNALNAHTALDWEQEVTSGLHSVYTILAPRILRLGLKWRF